MLLPAVVTVAAVALLLLGEQRDSEAIKRVAKPIASTGFVWAAIAAGGLDGSYGRAIVLALLLSWIGDMCLLSRGRGWFLAGLGAFLLGHVAFGAAFFIHGVALSRALMLAAAFAVPALVVRRWLVPYVPSAMRGPVDAYITVITGMVSLAIAATLAGGSNLIAIGAVMFYLSDLSVARDRFVRSELSNRLWGLPLYYGAQLVLASTICA